jgi:aldehyde oxidoreductase
MSGIMPATSTEMPPRTDVSFRLNGGGVSANVYESQSLLSVLRDDLGILSPKNGCEPMGQCGCCTVLLDGKPRLSCTMPAASVGGKSVVTLEGLPEDTRKQIADCFAHTGAVQCGFCIPGIAIRAHALCEKNANPTRETIEHELRAHLCRCTGYKKIVDAVELVASVRRGEPLPGNGCVGRVGERLPRYAGHAAALGDKPFIDDISVPGMAFAAPRLSDHPRALVKRINPAPALALPGVLRVVTAKDVPGGRFVGLITPDWPVFIAEGEETRYVGDVLAFAVATDMHLARRAAELIEIARRYVHPMKRSSPTRR